MNNLSEVMEPAFALQAFGFNTALKKAWKLFRFFVRLVMEFLIVTLLRDEEDDIDELEDKRIDQDRWVCAPSEFDAYTSFDSAMG